MAARMDVQADNLASFRQGVSISVPTKVTPFLLRNDPLQPPGNNILVPGLLDDGSTSNNSVQRKQIVRDARLVSEAHTDTTRYHAWETFDQTKDRVFVGSATLYVDKNGGSTQMTAGLFECWEGTPADPLPPSAITDADVDVGHKCVFIASASSVGGSSSNGFSERSAQFNFPETTIESGHRLRLKIVNNTGANWDLQWGFNSARSSQLQVTET